MKHKILSLILIAGLAFLYQCKPAKVLMSPTQTDLSVAQKLFPDISLNDLTKGHELYTTKCTKCHGAKNPANFTAEEWPKILSKMAPKAKLSDEEKTLVNQYFLVTRETSK
jgi:hypothetical protein